jgi:hypothetical protein
MHVLRERRPPMKSFAAVAVVTLTLIGAAPREAAAQDGSTAGAIGATIAGAAVGGALGYYYFTGVVATTIGVLAGGAIGDWWYTAASSGAGAMPGKAKMHYTDTPRPFFQLIGHSGGTQSGLHTAAFSAAAD